MKYEVGQLITGTVYAVKPYALFLSFSDGATGLLHISEISDSFIRDIERYGTVGDQIKVKIVSIDKANGFLRLSLKKVPQEEAYSTHENSNRSKVNVTKDDFKPLEEKLQGWIDETLVKAKGEKND